MKLRRALGVTAGLLLLLTGGAVAWSVRALDTPMGRGGEQVFEIPDGQPLARVVRRLEGARLIPRVPVLGTRPLMLWARLNGIDREVKAGEYDLSPQMTPREILEKLRTGGGKTYAITVPEGWSSYEIAARLQELGITGEDAFLGRVHSQETARALGVEADSLEGYLYPETYRFPRDASPDDVVRRMVEQFQAALKDEDRAALEASGRSLHEVVTLASIVEKETGVPDERSLIAAVFLNRLGRRMRLQSDPTVIYGIRRTVGDFDGNLRKADLLTDTPYNTYRRGGIPPGPIASVGIEAIRAVLAPEPVKFLYFVSRNDGTHHFSNTLREHNNAVNRYQRPGERNGPRAAERAAEPSSRFSAVAP
jgi:UPF0755 protein